MSNNGGSAFPYSALSPDGPKVYEDSEGMSLRDYFAAVALQGLIAAGTNGTVSDRTWTFPELRSKFAYEYADEMLKAREK